MKKSTEKMDSDKLRQTIKEALKQNPEEVLQILLEESYWPTPLKSENAYSRYDDDTQRGRIGVAFSPDGDAWIEVWSLPDPEEMNFMHRFRSYFGGGQSERVRMALIILAFAIHLDNQSRPQHRMADDDEAES